MRCGDVMRCGPAVYPRPAAGPPPSVGKHKKFARVRSCQGRCHWAAKTCQVLTARVGLSRAALLKASVNQRTLYGMPWPGSARVAVAIDFAAEPARVKRTKNGAAECRR